MILKQFYLGCLAHASYIVIDERTKVAAVIDPQRDIEQYLEEAKAHGATIKYVLLTHFHADFVAGHLELRDRVGAGIYLGAQAGAEYDFTALKTDDVIEFGDVRLRVLETPGHTPEGISVVVYDLAKSDTNPEAVFTGDTLFVGGVGRPDLMASIGITADELAGKLYDSLHSQLMPLPDTTLVYPAHGAGSMCGKNLGSETFSTIGEQRQNNYALQPMTKEAFVEVVTAEQSTAPAYFSYDAQMNKSERALLHETLERSLKPLSLEQVLEMQAKGVQVIDVRDPADFAGSHLCGSINIGLCGKFATWAGSVLAQDQPIVVIGDPGTEEEAAMRLGRIGFDTVAGYLEGGLSALESRGDLVSSVERTTAQEVAEQMKGDCAPLVLDVRGEREWESGHVAGSLNIPLPHLEQRMGEVPRGREIAIICRSGYRSSVAASLLLMNEVTDFCDLIGGMDAWVACNLETTVVQPSACQSKQEESK